MLLVKRLSSNAILPQRATKGAAGYDLSSPRDCKIFAHCRDLISTDLSIILPSGTYGRIAPRSGLATHHGLDVGAGVVDGDYRGPVGVLLFNHGNENYFIQKGERIAQLIIEKIETPEVQEIETLDEQTTERGTNGFGSTGVLS